MEHQRLIVISYVGAPLAGKSTSLHFLAKHLPNARLSWRRRLVDREMVVEADHPASKDVRVHIKTTGGAVWFPASWKMLLSEADALVLVLDAQAGRGEQQAEFLIELEDAIGKGRLDGRIPIVVQVNKVDLAADGGVMAASIAGEQRQRFSSVGIRGSGVLEAFRAAVDVAMAASADAEAHSTTVSGKQDWLPFGGRRTTR